MVAQGPTLTTSDARVGVQANEYAGVFRRRWPYVVVGLVLGLLLGALAVRVLPSTYASTASVMVQSNSDDTALKDARTNSEINLDTEAQIVKSMVVAKLAQERLGGDTVPRTLAEHVNVSVPANTTVLDITFSAPDPRAAQRGAQAFADAYLAQATISNRPAQELAEANDVPTSTAHRWLKEARARGLLRLPQVQLDHEPFSFAGGDR